MADPRNPATDRKQDPPARGESDKQQQQINPDRERREREERERQQGDNANPDGRDGDRPPD